MTHIIFNKNDFYNLKPQMRKYYQNIGDDVYVLKPKSFRLNTTDLPKYLSIDQYNANKQLISGLYSLTTLGFNRHVVKLMKLNSLVAKGVRTNYTNIQLPKSTIVSEEAFYRLAPKDKVKYNKIKRNGKIFYVTKGLPSYTLAQDTRSPVRPPTIGVRRTPMGRWVEVQ